MKRKADNTHRPGTFSLMNEGLYLLRAGGAETALLYAVASLPFLLGFLYFWSDMSRGGFAEQRMAAEAFLLALAFAWMKTGQALYCRRLWELRSGLPPSGFSRGHLCRVLINQVTVQPWGLVLIPLSLLLAVPFAVTHTFFQNYTVMDDGTGPRELYRRALRQARLLHLQNHLLIWLLSPWLLAFVLIVCVGGAALAAHLAGGGFAWDAGNQGDVPWILVGVLAVVLGVWPVCPLALTVAVNIGILVWVLPHLLNTFFGIETVFVRSGVYAIANSTVLLTIYVLTYLVLDPIMKSTYVLRCFYGDAAATGADLLADLKKPAILLIAVTALLVAHGGPAHAQAPPAPVQEVGSAQALDRAIESTLAEEAYAPLLGYPKRRITLTSPIFDLGKSVLAPVARWVGEGLRWLGKKLADLFAWLKKVLPWDRTEKEGPAPKLDMRELIIPLVYLLAFVLALAGGWQLVRLSRRRRRPAWTVAAAAPEAAPDLTDDAVRADMLPEAQWLALADRMAAENKPRLALRALFLAVLAFLEQWRIIRLAPYKSNRDYGQEIGRLAHGHPDLVPLFLQNARLFEKVWFGDYPVQPGYLAEFRKNQDLMRGCLAQRRT